MDGAQAAKMARVQRLQQIEGLGAADLTDEDAIRPVPQCCAQEIGNRYWRQRRLLSERRLRDWVAVLGFDVDSVYGYLGLLPTKGRLPRAAVAPRAAWAAGAYLLKARKRVKTLTLVRPRRRVRRRAC
jgi:hypothetical protein